MLVTRLGVWQDAFQDREAAAGSPMGELTEREARDLKPHLAEVTEAVREAVADVPGAGERSG